jgi:hypothetical protein
MNQEPHRNQCRRRVPDQSRLLAEPPPLVRTVEEQAKLRGRSEEGAHAPWTGSASRAPVTSTGPPCLAYYALTGRRRHVRPGSRPKRTHNKGRGMGRSQVAPEVEEA